MSTYLDFIPSPASIKAGDTEVHTGNPVDQVTITGDVNDFGVVIANQATDGDARITFSNNDRSYTLGLNGVSGSTNEDFRVVVGNNINTGTNVLTANQFGHLTIGRTTLTGGLQLRARTVTANTTLVNDTDHIIFANAASGNIVLTLPASDSNADGSSTVGKEYIIVKTDSSTNTVQIKGSAGTPGDSVNGNTNYLLRSQNETATVVRSTSSSWLVTASNKLPYFGNGSATNPSISFESDPNTGIYRPSAYQFGITTGGASRMVISSTGINVQNHKITNLGTPTANDDAATKAYVDGILTKVPVGTVGAAGLAFVGDANTGIYQPSADQFGITTGGASRMVLSSTGIDVRNHKITDLGTPTASNDAATKAYVDASVGAIGMADGTPAAPGWAFDSDTDTGIYRPTSNQFGITTGGAARMVISSAGINVQNHKITNLGTPTANNDAATKAYVDANATTGMASGSAAAPGWAFNSDTDTGIFRPLDNQIGFATSGSLRMSIANDGIYTYGHKIMGLGTPTANNDAATKAYVDGILTNVPVGTASTPGLAFVGDPNTGIYRPSGDRFGITTGGTSRMVISSTGIDVQNHKITNLGTPTSNSDAATKAYVDANATTGMANGTAAAPGWAFNSDTDTGIYRPTSNQFGITAGGAARMVISSAGINVQNHKITNLGTPTANNDAATKAYVDSLSVDFTSIPNGTTLSPSLRFVGSDSTGLSLSGSGDNTYVTVVTNGVPTWFFGNIVGTSHVSSLPIDMNGNKINGLGTPTASFDAATKGYVDDILTNVPAGNVSTAGLAFTGDPDTGIYRPNANQFGITAGGAARMVISSAGINVQNHKITNLGTPTANNDAATKAYVDANTGGVTGMADGTAAAPGWAFNSDTDTGIYRPLDNQIGFATSGSLRMSIANDGIYTYGHKIMGLGTPTANNDAATKAYVDGILTNVPVGNPSIAGLSFTGDSDTGIYRPSADRFGITTGGTARMIISSTGINVQNHKITSLGTPTANSDATTKEYVDGILTNVPVGTAFIAGLSFVGNTNTGIYRPSVDQFGITTGGFSRMVISSAGINVQNHKITNLGTPTANDDAATKAYVDANVGVVTGMADGTPAAPGLAFNSVPNTGIYRAINGMGFTVGGITCMTMTTDGIYVHSHRIRGMSLPALDGDAATKKYVDDSMSTSLQARAIYRTSSDLSITTSTTLVDLTDSSLSFPVTAGDRLILRAMVRGRQGNANANLRIAISLTGVGVSYSTIVYQLNQMAAVGDDAAFRMAEGASHISYTTIPTPYGDNAQFVVTADGVIQVAGIGGTATITLRGSQQTASGTTTISRAQLLVTRARG